MTFWDTFWATMAGALAGAVVGAVAAWIFALDLGRRDREARIKDDAERQAAQEARNYRTIMDAMIGQVVEKLHGLADELDQTPMVHVSRRLDERPPEPRLRARASVLAAVDAVSFHARGRDHEVLMALHSTILRLAPGREGGAEAAKLADALVAWKRFEPDSYEWVLSAFESCVPTNRTLDGEA